MSLVIKTGSTYQDVASAIHRYIQHRTGQSKDRQGFQLWGKSLYYDVRLVGGNYYSESCEILYGGSLGAASGIRPIENAELVHEPWNENDENAVSVYIKGLLVGYMPREDAQIYGPLVAQVRDAGFAAIVHVQLWYRETDVPHVVKRRPDGWDPEYDGGDYWVYDEVPGEFGKKISCSGQLPLNGSLNIYPVNEPPADEFVMLPYGRTIPVYDLEKHTLAIRHILDGAVSVAVYASLGLESDGRRLRVVVMVDGKRIGRLSIHMSKGFVPLIEKELERCPVVAAELELRDSGGVTSGHLNVLRPFEMHLSPTPWAEWIVNPAAEKPTVPPIDIAQYPDRFTLKA